MEQKPKPDTKTSKTAVVAGAGGLTGSMLLERLARDKSFKKIIVLSRKAIKPAFPKVQEIVVDFDRLDKHDFWPDADVLFCCIGTTMKKAGSKDNFRKVDYDIPVKLGKMCSLFRVDFHLISSIGADAESANFYLKTKGETENALKSMDLPSLHIYRPSMLYGPRKESRLGESIGKVVMWFAHPLLLGPLKKYRGIHSATVAMAMIKASKEQTAGCTILESEEIKKLAKG